MTASMVAVLVGLVCSFASMIVFAATFHQGYRDQDATRRGSRFLVGLGNGLVHWFTWALGPMERALLRAGATPDVMTLPGSPSVFEWKILDRNRQTRGRRLGDPARLGRDVLDGRLARELRVSSRYGKFVDSTFDRFVETFAFLGSPSISRAGRGGCLVVAAGLGGSLLVSYAQAVGRPSTSRARVGSCRERSA